MANNHCTVSSLPPSTAFHYSCLSTAFVFFLPTAIASALCTTSLITKLHLVLVLLLPFGSFSLNHSDAYRDLSRYLITMIMTKTEIWAYHPNHLLFHIRQYSTSCWDLVDNACIMHASWSSNICYWSMFFVPRFLSAWNVNPIWADALLYIHSLKMLSHALAFCVMH